MDEMAVKLVAALNDAHRQSLQGCVFEEGVVQLPAPTVAALLARIAEFDSWEEDTEPFRDHHCGCIELDGDRFLWKINYYGVELQHPSPNPADAFVTRRMLLIRREGDC